jgi:hypothetical protein
MLGAFVNIARLYHDSFLRSRVLASIYLDYKDADIQKEKKRIRF